MRLLPNTVERWDLKSGRRRQRIQLGDAVSNFAEFSPDGRYLVADDSTGKALIWDLETTTPIQLLTPPVENTNFVSAFFSPNGLQILTNSSAAFLLARSDESPARLWDTLTGKAIIRFPGQTGVAFSATGELIATAGQDHALRLWRTSDFKEAIRLDSVANNDVLAISPEGKSVACARDNATVQVLDMASGHETHRFNVGPAWTTQSQTTTEAGGDEARDFAANLLRFSPSGQLLLTAGGDNTARLWDLSSGKSRMDGVHDSAVLSAAFSPVAGRLLVTSSADKTVKIWDSESGRQVSTMVFFQDGGWVVVAPDGRFDSSNLEEIQGLSWTIADNPLTPLPLEIFMREYYQPQLLRQVFTGETAPPIKALAELNRVQPQIEITRIEPEDVNAGAVNVTVEISGASGNFYRDGKTVLVKTGAYDLRLFRDGHLVAQFPPRAAADGADGREDIRQWRRVSEIELSRGGKRTVTFHGIRLSRRADVKDTVFSAYAFNEDRVKSATSRKQCLFTERGQSKAAPASRCLIPRPPAGRRRAYVITMGVNANQSGWDLSLAAPSAKTAASLFRQKLSKDYDVVDINLASDLGPEGEIAMGDATKAHLRAILDLLAGRSGQVAADLRRALDPNGSRLLPATPDDAVVLYVASHGFVEPKGRFHIVPFDTGTDRGITEALLTRCLNQPDASTFCQAAMRFLNRTISSDDLATWLTGVDADELVMILDSCYSGAIPGRNFRAGPLGDRGFGQLAYDMGMRILTAAQPDRPARATKLQGLGHTLLVESLKRAAESAVVTDIPTWLRAAERRLPERASQLYPELKHDDLQLPELLDFRRETTRMATAAPSR